MPKAIEDFIDGETFRAIKGLSLPAMNSYLYTIYAAGYAAGLSDAGGEKLREAVQNITGQIEELLKTEKRRTRRERVLPIRGAASRASGSFPSAVSLTADLLLPD